jgi:hypothetical protein
MSTEENKAIVSRFLEALDQQNFDALRFLISGPPSSSKLQKAILSQQGPRCAAHTAAPCLALSRPTSN